MREIKFRAWAIEDKKFIDPNSVYVNGNGDLLSYGSRDDTGGFNQVVVIQRSTGLHDKNGIPIFEGDVVYANEFWKRAIVAYYAPKFVLENRRVITDSFYPDEWATFEVLGNIYEHPNLFQEKKGDV